MIVKELEDLPESFSGEFPPLLTGASRTATVGIDESSGLELEIRDSFPVGKFDDSASICEVDFVPGRAFAKPAFS